MARKRFVRALWVLAFFGFAVLPRCEKDSGPGDLPPDAWCAGGKCDAINPENDPSNLGFTIRYELADESLVGVTLISDLIPYSPPTYYPFTSDGINKRDYGQQASPAEKYDLAFTGWSPDESFWSLERLESTSDREFDQAYYDGLGAVALWEHNEHGLGRLHDGVDNDGDDLIDFDDDNNEGLEGWFGYCNGNTAASLSVPGPLHSAAIYDVEFTANDIMALLAAVHYDDRSTMTGLRCEALKPATDEYGRYVNEPWFKKQGEGAEITSFEVLQGPVWFDDTKEWVAYLIGIEGGKRGIIRLSYEEFKQFRKEVKPGSVTFDQQNWEEVEFSIVGKGCRDTNPATLYLAVTNILGRNRVPFGIDADSGSHVWNYPIYQAKINEQKMIDKAEANRTLGVPEDEDYPFNDEAVNFAYVDLTLEKSHSMGLQMVLELDEANKVIGGEWSGGSRSRHPDFIWIPMGADTTGYNTEGTYMTFGDDKLDGRDDGSGGVTYTDAPDMGYSNVRRLVAMSRTAENESYNEYDGAGETINMGDTATLPVTVEAQEGTIVKEVLVYMDGQADFVPGLKITLESPDGVSVKLLDIPHDNTQWEPGRFPTGWDLGVLRGAAHPMPLFDESGDKYPGLAQFADHPAGGEWKLEVTNIQAGSAKINSWSLWLTTSP
jgi:hypothetical protein